MSAETAGEVDGGDSRYVEDGRCRLKIVRVRKKEKDSSSTGSVVRNPPARTTLARLLPPTGCRVRSTGVAIGKKQANKEIGPLQETWRCANLKQVTRPTGAGLVGSHTGRRPEQRLRTYFFHIAILRSCLNSKSDISAGQSDLMIAVSIQTKCEHEAAHAIARDTSRTLMKLK